MRTKIWHCDLCDHNETADDMPNKWVDLEITVIGDDTASLDLCPTCREELNPMLTKALARRERA